MRKTFFSGALAALSLAITAPAAAQTQKLYTGIPGATGSADLVQQARRVLTTQSPALAQLTLAHVATFPTAHGQQVVKLRQTHMGLPVAARGASVVLDPSGKLQGFAASRVEQQLPSDATPALDASWAALQAGRLTGAQFRAGDATLGWMPMADGVRLAWVVYRGVIAPLPTAPVVVVDAKSGELLLAYDAVRHDRQAEVHEFNPTITPTPITTTLDQLAPGATTLENELVRVLNCVDNQTTTNVYGSTIHTCELEQRAVADAQGDFLEHTYASDTAGEDTYAEVAMFYHATKAYAYMTSLGMPELLTKPLPAVVNLRMTAGMETWNQTTMSDPNIPLVPFDNAFFSPENPIFTTVFGLQGAAMWFGQGSRADFSYDGDVVYHEFGHAVIDRTAQLSGYWNLDEQGATAAPGAMNEGFADYLSSAITGDGQVGEYVGGGLGGGLIRDLDNDHTCPENLSGEVHTDATFFAGALWKVRQSLPEADRTTFDEAIMTALISVPSGDLGFEAMADLLITAVGQSPLGQAAAGALSSEVEARGFLTRCDRVYEWDGQPIFGPDPQMRNAFMSAGKGYMPLPSSAPYAPGLFQVHAQLEPNAVELVVSWIHQDAPDGSLGFGPQGDPYTPAVLVHFGSDPISFQYASGVVSNAGDPIDVRAIGGGYQTEVEVPEGASEAWVMVVNKGDLDGMYNSLWLETRSAPPIGAGGAPGVGGAGGAAGTPTQADPDPRVEIKGGGCACRATTGAPAGKGAWLLALTLGMALARRKRR